MFAVRTSAAMRRQPPRLRTGARAVAITGVLTIGLLGCGSSGKPARGPSPAKTTTSTTPANSTNAGTTPSPARRVRARITGQNHDPKVGALWSYTVTATDATGHPLNGTVEIEFVFNGSIVGRDTPPTHPVRNGRWHDRLTFPAAAVGVPLAVRAVVHTSAGSAAADWPVKVRQ